jgi:hypothetical protein
MLHHDMWGMAFGAGAGSSGEFGSEGPQLMQDLANGLPRGPLLGTSMNRVPPRLPRRAHPMSHCPFRRTLKVDQEAPSDTGMDPYPPGLSLR